MTLEWHWPLRTVPRRYGFAVLIVACAMLLNLGWLVNGYEPHIAPFLAAILLTGWHAGTGPVAVATTLSSLVFFGVVPPGSVEFGWDFTARLVWFGAFAFAAGWFSTARRNSAAELERARSALEDRVNARTAELRRSEQYLIAAQALSRTGSWALEMSTGTVTWSEECARIFGQEVLTGRPRLRDIAHPHDLASATEAINGAVARHEAFETHFRIIRPDQTVRYVRSIGRPVLDGGRAITEYVGVVIDVTDRKLSARRLRRARERAAEAHFAAILDERARLAREMHDTLLQGFTGVGLRLVAVTNRIENAPETVAALREVIASAQATLENARHAIWDMRPQSTMSGDLPTRVRAAAEEAISGSGINLQVQVEGSVRRVPAQGEYAVYRMVQEAVANVVAHAAAKNLRIGLTYRPKQLSITISDDGVGFIVDPDFRSHGGHFGLLGIRERICQARGTFTVRSAPSAGTEITVTVPLSSRRRSRPELSQSGGITNSASPNGE